MGSNFVRSFLFTNLRSQVVISRFKFTIIYLKRILFNNFFFGFCRRNLLLHFARSSFKYIVFIDDTLQ